MWKYSMRGATCVALCFLLLLVAMPAFVSGEEAPSSDQTKAMLSGQLAANGGWTAYKLEYPGDGLKMKVKLDLVPADPFTAEGFTMDVYSQDNPPPDGDKVGSASADEWPGVKYWRHSSDDRGTFILVLHNFDPLNRPVDFTVATYNEGVGEFGPALVPVQAVAAEQAIAPAAPAPAPAPAAAEGKANVTGQLPTFGAWAAYTLQYPGGDRPIKIKFDYSPADPFTDQGVTFDIYSQTDPPPGGDKIGSGAADERPGAQFWKYSSEDAGSVILVLHNFDPLHRSVDFTLTSVYEKTGEPGPALVSVSSGQ